MTNTGDLKHSNNMNILRAFEIFQSQQAQVQKLEPREFYRLYYTENHKQAAFGPPWPELDWPYIDITAAQASSLSRYKLENGRLELIDTGRTGSVKYKESENGPYLVVADHMALIVETGEKYHAIKRVSADPN